MEKIIEPKFQKISPVLSIMQIIFYSSLIKKIIKEPEYNQFDEYDNNKDELNYQPHENN